MLELTSQVMQQIAQGWMAVLRSHGLHPEGRIDAVAELDPRTGDIVVTARATVPHGRMANTGLPLLKQGG